MQDLIIGLVLIAASIIVVQLSRPKNGKTAWFVGKPFLAPLVSIAIVASLALGFFMIAAHFTTIDDATIAGTVRKL
ncbi:MAG: hypothetical protein GC182_10780 [Rhodopseudomonas sp.]|nr:hypothetical protein [Rhodopseudomonas sp.]